MSEIPRQHSIHPPQADAPLVITADMLVPARPKETRIDFERGISYVPKITTLLILANVAMFIVELVTGALKNSESIIAAGALHRDSVLRGEVWRMVSSMFLHGGFDHLLGNCFVLYIIGMGCEHGVGVWRTAVVYFVGGLSGSLLSVLANPGPSVGASGAIFGLTGGLIIFLYRHRDIFFLREKRTSIVLVVWAAYQICVGFLTPFVDNFAHIGGLIGGALCMWPMRPRVGC
jgi:rhomboid protease GluP